MGSVRADGVTDYVAGLASAVRRRLAKLPTGLGSLAEAATGALEAMPPGPDVGALPVLAHAASVADLPAQRPLSDMFGQPPLIVHRDPEFFIQALTWVEGTTAIHQHGFEGAFAVADGLSLHVPYDFSAVETLADGHLITGDLRQGTAEILPPGSVRTIAAGFAFIHALFHLERPTLTFVVRNNVELPYPQYSYMRPGVGWDQLNVSLQDGKRRQAVNALLRLDTSAAHRAVVEVVEDGPPWLAFLFVHDWMEHVGWTQQTAELCGQLEHRLPALAGVLPTALADEAQQRSVLRRRSLLREPPQRLFLALLANLPDRPSVEAVLGALHPGRRPQDVLWEAIADLASPGVRSISGLRLADDQLEDIRTLLLAADGGRSAPHPDIPGLDSSWQRLPALLRGLLEPGSATNPKPDPVGTSGAES